MQTKYVSAPKTFIKSFTKRLKSFNPGPNFICGNVIFSHVTIFFRGNALVMADAVITVLFLLAQEITRFDSHDTAIEGSSTLAGPSVMSSTWTGLCPEYGQFSLSIFWTSTFDVQNMDSFDSPYPGR